MSNLSLLLMFVYFLRLCFFLLFSMPCNFYCWKPDMMCWITRAEINRSLVCFMVSLVTCLTVFNIWCICRCHGLQIPLPLFWSPQLSSGFPQKSFVFGMCKDSSYVLTYIKSFNHHNHSMRWLLLLLPFYT